MQSLKRQIVFTVAYSNIFQQPLTANEVFKRLLFFSGPWPLEFSQLEKALGELAHANLLRKESGYWQLASIKQDLSKIRIRREELSAEKIAELSPFVSFVEKLPWITGIALTGSVAMLNAEEKDDVDVLVVTQDHRLWLVRPLLVLFSFLHGKRRSWNHEEENSWCLNLWLEERALAVPADRHSFYTAYEVTQAFWVVDKGGVARTFLVNNEWVQEFLPEYYTQQLSVASEGNKSSSGVLGIEQMLSLLNEVAYLLQRWYMKAHMTREKVSRAAAFFHPRDTKRQITQQLHVLIRAFSTAAK